MTIRVLLVEDNEDNTKLMEWILEELDCKITYAKDGEQALEVSKGATFDLVLMDIRLPGMSGEQVTEKLRAMPSMKDVPVIAVTAHAVTTELERIRACGFDEIVTKPIDVPELMAKIERLLS